MKLTKYEHACFTVEQDGQVLVVDPGNFTSDFIAPDGVVAVMITHEHQDHFESEYIQQIVDKNPEVTVVADESVIATIETPNKQAVKAGDTFDIGPFHLEFFGGEHAIIHDSLPRIANLGVMINDLIYYPGDSFALPNKPVDVLALPAAAPWMKIGEAMDFLTTITPRLAFPTHDAVSSDIGKQLADRMLGGVAKQQDTEYRRLTEPLEI